MLIRLIALTLAFILVGCGSDDSGPTAQDNSESALDVSNNPEVAQTADDSTTQNSEPQNTLSENQDTVPGDVITTASGLQYQVLRESTGQRPGPNSVVTVHYVGTLTDGTQFDSSYDRGTPATFNLRNVIKGWQEGVQLMTVGSQFRFIIPPDLAYGDTQTGVIPPNSTLVFEVELLEINS